MTATMVRPISDYWTAEHRPQVFYLHVELFTVKRVSDRRGFTTSKRNSVTDKLYSNINSVRYSIDDSFFPRKSCCYFEFFSSQHAMVINRML